MIKFLDGWFEEVLADVRLAHLFQRVTGAYGAKGELFGECSKLQKLRATLSAHLQHRVGSGATLSMHREYYACIIKATQDGVASGDLEREMSRDFLGGNNRQGIISFWAVLCWRFTLCRCVLRTRGVSDEALCAKLLEPDDHRLLYSDDTDQTWCSRLHKSCNQALELVHSIHAGERDATLCGVEQNRFNASPLARCLEYGTLQVRVKELMAEAELGKAGLSQNQGEQEAQHAGEVAKLMQVPEDEAKATEGSVDEPSPADAIKTKGLDICAKIFRKRSAILVPQSKAPDVIFKQVKAVSIINMDFPPSVWRLFSWILKASLRLMLVHS